MAPSRASLLDVGVVVTTGATALWAAAVAVVSFTQLDLLVTAVAVGSLAACAVSLGPLWRSPVRTWVQTAALVGCAIVTFSTGAYAFPPIGYAASLLLVGVGVRRGEQRTAADRLPG